MLRSTPIRLAVAFTALFVIGSLVSNQIALRVIGSELDALENDRVRDRYLDLARLYEAEGLEALVNAIESIDLPKVSDSDIAALIGPDGNALSGARFSGVLAAVPVDGASMATAELFDNGWEHDARVYSGRLDEGHRLVVATSSEATAEVGEIVLGAFVWSTLVMLALAIGGAAQIASTVRLRFDSLRGTMHEIADGNLAARIPLSPRGDDIDELGSDINHALERLEKAIGLVRQVSTDIAHDLRTPLGRLRISLEQAIADERAGRSTAARLEDALSTCDAIAGTFSALLRISRLETGERRRNFAPVDLHALVARVVDLYEEVAEDEGGSLVLSDMNPDDAFVMGDAALLTQLFANLVENALQHCPSGVRIECAVGVEAGRVVASVADDGPGVPEHERERVLQRLFRLDSSRTTPGSGLGLSLVKAIADLHGARLALHGDAPGLRVRLELDRVSRSAARLPRPPN